MPPTDPSSSSPDTRLIDGLTSHGVVGVDRQPASIFTPARRHRRDGGLAVHASMVLGEVQIHHAAGRVALTPMTVRSLAKHGLTTGLIDPGNGYSYQDRKDVP